jgi:hypothetical protein
MALEEIRCKGVDRASDGSCEEYELPAENVLTE